MEKCVRIRGKKLLLGNRKSCKNKQPGLICAREKGNSNGAFWVEAKRNEEFNTIYSCDRYIIKLSDIFQLHQFRSSSFSLHKLQGQRSTLMCSPHFDPFSFPFGICLRIISGMLHLYETCNCLFDVIIIIKCAYPPPPILPFVHCRTRYRQCS